MPVRHEPIPAHAHARSRPLRAGVVALVAVAMSTPLTSAEAQVAAVPAPPRAAAEAGPHPVPPTVTELAVPAVPEEDRGSIAARLKTGTAGSAAADGDTLAAHVRKPRMHGFAMVGVTWDAGSAAAGTTVSVRSRSQGTWSDWTALVIDPDEGPAPRQEDSVRDGTTPAWVGAANGLEVAVYSADGSPPTGLRVDAIDPGTSSYDAVTTLSTTSTGRAGPEAGTFPGLPDVIDRSEWGVDPSLGDRCWKPRFGDTFKAVFVHHTAGSNSYTRSESAAVVRGVYAYHTQSRGWCDIGYNFLVDRYGKIYEGRRGGIRPPVRGSHAGDYNVDTTGISLMGDFTSQNATRPMKHSLVQLIAWRMGTAYHGAYGRPFVYDRRFSRIAAHRAAMATSCPGEQVHAWLPTLRERVATRLGDYESRIEAQWRALGGIHSRLGEVRLGEQGENGGRHTSFANGRMYSSDAGINALYRSPILTKYLSLGETDGNLGYPHSNLRSIVNHTGLSAEFDGGRIFWSKPTGATTLLRSAILKRYIAEGSAAGPLGFPTVPVHPIETGALARFQHGTIAWDAESHKTVVSYS